MKKSEIGGVSQTHIFFSVGKTGTSNLSGRGMLLSHATSGDEMRSFVRSQKGGGRKKKKERIRPQLIW